MNSLCVTSVIAVKSDVLVIIIIPGLYYIQDRLLVLIRGTFSIKHDIRV